MTEKPASLAEALLMLQADLPTVAKRQTAKVETAKGSYSYKYAGLGAVNTAVLPRLNRLGLVFTARPTVVEGRFVLCCELVHVASGERLTAEYPLAAAPNAPAQAVGSAISYGRRYCLTAMTGIVAEDDDDGRAASIHYDEPAAPRRNSRSTSTRDTSGSGEPEVEPYDRDRRTKRLFALYREVGPEDREERLADLSQNIGRTVSTSSDLTDAEIEAAIAALEKRKRERAKANGRG